MSKTKRPKKLAGAFGEKPGQNYIVGYMCKIDYECELGCTSGGIEIYSSVEDLKSRRSCVSECGIVKVKIKVTKVVQDTNFARYT